MLVLRVAAAVEALTLAIMLTNLFTAHVEVVGNVCGPTHGMSYLTVVAATSLLPTASRRARWLAFVPGVGGFLALREIHVRAHSARKG
ncbi:hypothetical protein [Nocardiopsis halotolerans]|uniref:hypothetical protein n=1 Tax=Nocardiopsis halotolerans TaxID=124252 RepID=UPI00034789C1|nr:hypothetical protein [Nocardiopsis halotolerans]